MKYLGWHLLAAATIVLGSVLISAPPRTVALRPYFQVTPGEEDANLAGYKLHVWGVDQTNDFSRAVLLGVIDCGSWEANPVYPIREAMRDLPQTNRFYGITATAYNGYGLESREHSAPVYLNPARPAKVTLEMVNEWVVQVQNPIGNGGGL